MRGNADLCDRGSVIFAAVVGKRGEIIKLGNTLDGDAQIRRLKLHVVLIERHEEREKERERQGEGVEDSRLCDHFQFCHLHSCPSIIQ